MENRTFSIIFGLDVFDYENKTIEEIGFSQRTYVRLKKIGIHTVSDLLVHKPEDLMQISGFGATCQKEIQEYLKNLSEDKENRQQLIKKNFSKISNYKELIYRGDFSFENDLSELEKKEVEIYKNAYNCIDSNLLIKCEEDKETILKLCNSLSEFYIKFTEEMEQKKEIGEERLKCNVKHFIIAYTADLKLRETLFSVCKDDEDTLDEYISRFVKENELFDDNIVIKKFIKWCKFDVREEVFSFLRLLKEDKRYYDVLKYRAERKTLEQVGEFFGLTRERIRQIEKKASLKFSNWQAKSNILLKIFADRNGDKVLTPTKLNEYFGDETSLMLYLFRNNSTGDVIYDKQLDVFIIGDGNMAEKIQEFVDTLPDTFNENKLQTYIWAGIKEQGLSEDLLIKSIEENYKKTGITYHRSRLTLEGIYSDILKRFYPEGMHVYDTSELERFRNLVQEEYGIELSRSDRSISAILGRIGILCDRGTYRLNEGQFISDELAASICSYINSSDAPIFLTNTIFSIFEKELLNENINNKYFLQGILREKYGDRWIFRRDYISKDESFTSVYASVVDFIEKSKYPVSKDDIFNAFPGITDIVVSLSVSDPEILNLFGVYIHSSKLRLSKNEISYLHGKVEEALEKGNICHCKEIYKNVDLDYPELLKNNYINLAFGMYSLLEYLFGNEYGFSRPFIARKGVKIERINDILTEMVSESEKIEIEEIQRFAKEHHFIIYNILDFIDSCNATHFLINNVELEKIHSIGIEERTVNMIDDILASEVIDTMPISYLQCIYKFPEINEKWDEWLIYSVIKKWSKRFEVAASSNQFKTAVPIIAPKGKMDIGLFNSISKNEIGRMSTVDDLNDIDNLLDDINLDEIGGV